MRSIASTIATPATRPGAGNGSIAAIAPVTSAIQPQVGRTATPQVANGHAAGPDINGQVNSINDATPRRAAAPADGTASAQVVPSSTAGTMINV